MSLEQARLYAKSLEDSSSTAEKLWGLSVQKFKLTKDEKEKLLAFLRHDEAARICKDPSSYTLSNNPYRHMELAKRKRF